MAPETRKQRHPIHPRQRPCPDCGARPGEPCTTRVGSILLDVHCTIRVTGHPVKGTVTYPEQPSDQNNQHTQTTQSTKQSTTQKSRESTGVPNKSEMKEALESSVDPPENNPIEENTEEITGEKPAGFVEGPLNKAPATPEPQPEEPVEGTGGVNKSTEDERQAEPEQDASASGYPYPTPRQTFTEEAAAGDLDFGDEEYLFNSPKKAKPENTPRTTRKIKTDGKHTGKQTGKVPAEPSLF